MITECVPISERGGWMYWGERTEEPMGGRVRSQIFTLNSSSFFSDKAKAAPLIQRKRAFKDHGADGRAARRRQAAALL